MGENLKKERERSLCLGFLTHLNEKRGTAFAFSRLGKPGEEPDCVCSNGLGIEIVSIYDNHYIAEKQWAEYRAKKRGSELLAVAKIPLLWRDELPRLIGEKIDKLNKGLYGSPAQIILLCSLPSPLIEDAEVEEWVRTYNPFRQDGFFDRFFDEIHITWKGADGADHLRHIE